MSTKTHVWTTDCDYLGVTGADSVEQMAQAIYDRSHAPMDATLEIMGLENDADVATIEERLRTLTVKPVSVSAAIFQREEWDSAHVRTIALTERPGRGRVKVLGVQL